MQLLVKRYQKTSYKVGGIVRSSKAALSGVEMTFDDFSQRVSMLSHRLEGLQAEFISSPVKAPEILSDALESLKTCIEYLKVADMALKRQNKECIKSEEESIDALAMMQSLQTHQIELEMQNEELKHAKLETEVAMTKYSDLYDFAPLGFFTLDRDKFICEVNLAGAELLGMPRSNLVNKGFGLFIDTKDRPAFEAFCNEMQFTKIKQKCELRLLKSTGEKIYALIEGTAMKKLEYRLAIIDITKGKHAEEELKKSEEKFQLVADFTYDWEMWSDQNGDCVYVSPSCERITGYSPKEFLKDPDLSINIAHPDDREALKQHINASFNESSNGELIDYRITTKKGEIRWINHICQPVFGEKGNWLGRRISNRDITERKQAEEALLRSEQEKSAILNGLKNVSVEYLDPQMHIVWLNNAVQKHLGLSEDELKGTRCFKVIQGLESPCPGCTALKALQTAQPQEGELITPDGKTWISHSNLIKDAYGCVAGAIHVAVNISDRKRAEKALAESEDMYRAIFENTGTSTIIIENDTIISLANSEFERFTGYSKEKIEGKISWTEFIVKEDLERMLLQHKLRRIDPNAALNNYEFRAIDKNGNVKDILLRVGEIPGTKKSIASLLDITERKQMEEDLRESKERYRVLAEASQDMIYVIGRDDKIEYVNGSAARGLNLQPNEIIGRLRSSFFPSDATDRQKLRLDKVFDTGIPAHTEDVMIVGGREIWQDTILIPLEKEGDGIYAVLGISRDITERKREEEELKRIQLRLRIAMDLVKLVQWEYDVETDLFTFDDQFYALYGTTAEREGGTLMSSQDYSRKFIPAEEAPLVAKEISKALATADPNFTSQVEHRIIRADGTEGFIAIRFAIIKDEAGRTIKIYGANQDITERKKAEIALKESKDYLDKIINSIGDPLFVKDRQHKITLVNDAACKLFGRPRKEILDRTTYDLFSSKEMAEISRKKDEEVFNTGVEVTNEETNTYADKTLTVLVKKTPYTDNAGNQFLVGITRDITDRKQAEDRIIVSLKEKEILLKEVHHRVKNNLQIISALLSLQSSYLTDEDIIKIFRDSQNRIKSMALVHENLYRSKDLGKVDFNEYINQLVSHLYQSYGELAGKISFKINSENVYLNINTAIPCGMIINELISNSFKHAFPDDRSGEVCVDLSSEEDGFRLVISDNGIGIKGDINIKESKTLGLRLIDTLVRQIDGKMSLDTSNRTRCEIHFKGLK